MSDTETVYITAVQMGGKNGLLSSIGDVTHASGSVCYQKVYNSFRLDKQVTSQKEDAEDHGEREHAHDRDLNHAHHKEVALVHRGGEDALHARGRG